MRQINLYILEKLNLSKDNKNLSNDTEVNTVVALMTDICCLNLDEPKIKGILMSFEDWVRKNNILSIDEVECLIDNSLYFDKHLWNLIKKKNLTKFITFTDPNIIRYDYYMKYIMSRDWKKYIKARISEERNDLGSTYETDNGEFIYFTNYTGITVVVFRKKEK